MLVFWQMPHFFSIAVVHYDDYVKAGIPVLPVKKGFYKTKVRMIIYIISFILSAAMLTLFNYTGHLYLAVAIGFGIAWLFLGLNGFQRSDDQLWGRQMFRLSLVLITAVCIIIPLDLVN